MYFCDYIQTKFYLKLVKMMRKLSEKFHRLHLIMLAGVLFYAIAGYFTRGYYNPDEHYQILEFAGHKLGFFPKIALPWEFDAQIRPSLQPYLAMGVIQLCRGLGITEAFDWAMILRFISGGLSLWVFYTLSRPLSAAFERPQSSRMLLLGAAVFCWFMPFLSVRFSSENWSALTLLAGLYVLLMTEDEQCTVRYRQVVAPLLAGVFFGLSFWFRFQTAFALLGIGLWMLFIRRPRLPISSWLSVVAGSLFSIVLGIVLDRIFYGQWVFTPYNYYKVNILEDKASSFGIEPFWWYLPASIQALVWPIGLVLFALFLYGAHCARRHVMLWAVIPFVVGHSLIAHKELRFMFPLLFPFLFLVVVGFERATAAINRVRGGKFIWYAVWIALFSLNSWFLYTVNTQPATEGFPYFHFLASRARTQEVVLYSESPGPYPPFEEGLMRACFYRSEKVKITVLDNWQQLSDKNRYPLKKGVLVLTTEPEKIIPYITGLRLKKVLIYEQAPSPESGIKPRDWVFYEIQ
jgi:GPI mannosyltransferase 3